MPHSVKILISSLFMFIVLSCNKTTGPTVPNDNNSDPIITDYSNFHFTITDFTEVVFKNNDGLISDEKDVEKISVGYMLTEIDFGELASVVPTYTQVDSGYRLDFELTVKEGYYIGAKDYSLRYYFVDNSFVQIDTTVNYFKYPYENSEKWFDFGTVGSVPLWGGEDNLVSWFLLDFELDDNDLYFSYAPYWGVAKYNIKTSEKEDVVINFNPEIEFTGKVNAPLYADGFNFAIDGHYLFCDYGHGVSGLYRYNMLTDSTEVRIEIPSMTVGIEAANDTLFFILEENDLSNIYFLKLYTYAGDFLNSIRLPQTEENGYYCLESYKGILYIWNDDKILRLNLSDLTFLKPLISPLPYGYGGFDIHENILYYIVEDFNWGEDNIHWIELSELREVE